jgi:hypothetical protein
MGRAIQDPSVACLFPLGGAIPSGIMYVRTCTYLLRGKYVRTASNLLGSVPYRTVLAPCRGAMPLDVTAPRGHALTAIGQAHVRNRRPA